MARTTTLAFRNAAQKILWTNELSGQISDGHWENTPNTSWEAWCDATVTVDPHNVGRDFYVRKDNFGFNRRELLDIVGDRMMGYVRIARAFGLEDEEGTVQNAQYVAGLRDVTSKYQQEIVDDLQSRGIELDELRAANGDESLYSPAEMLNDLRDMMRIIKQRRHVS